MPGDSAFSAEINRKIEMFHSRKGDILRNWAREKGLIVDDAESRENMSSPEQKAQDRAQLYLLLYMENLVGLT